MSVFPQRIVLRNTTDSLAAIRENLTADVLLLHGNGANDSTTIIDSTIVPKFVTAVGNARISTAQSKFGGSSIFFDGISDYLTVDTSTAFALGTADFTIEMWVYRVGTALQRFYDASEGLSTSGGLSIGVTANSYLSFIGTGSVERISTTSVVPSNVWSHVAVCRSAGSTRMFLNGAQVGSTYVDTTSYLSPTDYVFVGTGNYETDAPFSGYIDELRVTRGLARYPSNFTPPTAPFADKTASAELLIAGEPMVIRQSGRTRIVSTDVYGGIVEVTARIKDGNKGSLTISNEGYGSTSFTLNDGSVTGNEIINGSLTSTKISGTIGIDKGGTGQSSPVTAINALLPSQTGNAGKALTSDGVNVSWTDYPLLAAAAGISTYPEGQTLSVDGIPDVNAPINPSNVSLLLRGDGVNDSTTIVDSSPEPKILLRFGNTRISTTQSKFGGSSIFFDGSDDRLITPPNDSFNFSTGDFTIEFWVYHISITASRFYISAEGSGGLFFGVFSTNSSIGWGRVSVGWDSTAVHGMSTNTWNHVALCRSDSSMRMFVNGSQIGSTVTNSISYDLSTGALNVGSQGASAYFNGFIDDLRVVKGSALYTANFTPPITAHPAPATLYLNQSLKWDSLTAKWIQAEDVTVPIPWGAVAPGKAGQFSKDNEYLYVCVAANTWKRIPYSAWTTSLAYPPLVNANTSLPVPRAIGVADSFYQNTSLLLHFDGANGSNVYTDTSQNAFSGSPQGGAVLSTAQSKFGGSSGFFNSASSQYVIFANSSAFHFGSENFTIEAWIRLTAITGEHCICSHSYGGFNGHSFTFSVNGSTQMKFRLMNSGGNTVLADYQPVFSLAVNTWYHVAVVRNGNLFRIFVNGVLPPTDLSVATVLHNPPTSNSTFKIGAANPFNNATPFHFFPGYIDDLRVTKGVARYWTAFTPPAYAFPEIG